MAKRVCKFFAHGACLKGNHCEFVHDWRARSNHICNFYQKGLCTYGSRCKYEHVKVTHSPSAPRSSLEDISNSLPIQPPSVAAVSTADFAPIISTEQSSSIGGNGNSDHHDLLDDDDNLSHSMCSLAAEGDCLRGENCPDIHGELCPICNKECLHPFRPQEREEHLRSCEERQKHLEALKHSEEIECNVCLERVFSKPTPAERRFGILPECDHPFCISCIRNWRSNSSFGIDINSALRACPTCRTRSYYVVPSSVWYFSKEEKQDIVQSYKGKLRSIDCKHFDFGNGICPFGTSCFYRHTYRDGNRNLQQPANYDIFWLSNILDNLHLG